LLRTGGKTPVRTRPPCRRLVLPAGRSVAARRHAIAEWRQPGPGSFSLSLSATWSRADRPVRFSPSRRRP